MFWIFDCRDVWKKERFELRKKLDNEGGYTFRWYYPRKSISYCQKTTYLDFGEYIFKVNKMYHECPLGGWGNLMHKAEFINVVLH